MMVSVIIPAYNAEATIEACVRSVLCQTHTDLEILVINDGSSDATSDKVADMAKRDSRVRLIDQENSGVSMARNCGIKESTGEYLCFIDADDCVEPEYVEMLASLSNEGTLPVVGFSINFEDRNALIPFSNEPYKISSNLATDYFFGPLAKSISFSACNKMFAKKLLLQKNILFSPTLKLGEDMEFVFRYLCHCKEIRVSDRVLYRYCVNEGSATRTASDMIDYYETTFKALKTLDENGFQVEENALAGWAMEAMTYVLMNPYVFCMNYALFNNYFRSLKGKEIYSCAIRGCVDCGIKRNWLRCALRSKRGYSTYLLVKLNRLLNRL